MGHGGIFGHSSLGATSSLDLTESKCAQLSAQGMNDRNTGRGMNLSSAIETWSKAWGQDPSACLNDTNCSSQSQYCYEQGYNSGSSPQPVTPQVTPPTANFAGQPCNSPAIIQMVQGAINTTADGKWGPASQTALAKAGGTFQSYAPGCTGNPPSYGAITGGGGGTTVVTTNAPPTYGQPGATSSMSGLLSKPIVWVGLAMAAVGGYVLLTSPKKGKKMQRNARNLDLERRWPGKRDWEHARRVVLHEIHWAWKRKERAKLASLKARAARLGVLKRQVRMAASPQGGRW